MSIELLLNFSDTNQLVVTFDGESSQAFAFENPIAAAELQEVRWYLETYGAQYTADVDDDRAGRVHASLKKIGTALYKAVVADSEGGAVGLLREFLKLDESGRLLTVQSTRPEILALPWELLHVPNGAYVFNAKPRISIRRNLAGMRGGMQPKRFQPKEKLRLLMVVSRPSDAGFIDPRGESIAVLNAIEQFGAGRIAVEFLRPGTLAALEKRLENEALPAIDILHFDGHGVFDATGRLADSKEVAPSAALKGEGKNMGYLLFEKGDGTQDLVSAERLGELLNQQGLGLVVLSACQSSMMGAADGGADEETGETGAIGSVAARLTQTGVQSVVAMSYSVLVKTTEMLFGAFYGNLVRGQGIGTALDNARRSLLLNPDRGERSRGQERVVLRLEDWFVPTLYQSGNDRGMLVANTGGTGSPLTPNSGGTEPGSSSKSPSIGGFRGPTMESPIAGFFGRRRELWNIERAFVPNRSEPRKETRRMTIAGFGGQGKTALALEVGRWLVRSGMFECFVFVDYQAFQGRDVVAVAVSTMARDLEVNLIDGAAATGELGRRSVLVILDNLEDLAADVQRELLTAAIAWSEAGQSRVLITTRQDDLGHSRYGRSGYEHQLIALKGLGSVAYPEDAIDYFQALMQVPPLPSEVPSRANLIKLFAKVDFHPLSIALVADLLRERGIVDVMQGLDRLLAAVPGDDKHRCLIASLNLSLERLDAGARSLVRRLGVFQGGAMELEEVMFAITEFTPEQWQPLRRQLAAAGLVTAESLEHVGLGVPFLKFHPTLAGVLWAQLSAVEQAELQQRHRERYYALSGWAYHEDKKNPYAVRPIVQRELPNLLVAVRGAIAAGEGWAVDFVNNVNRFLYVFGMQGDRQDLNDRAAQVAQAVGSRGWYLARSNAGEQLLQAGQPQRAKVIFEEILVGLGDSGPLNLPILGDFEEEGSVPPRIGGLGGQISYERCLTLGRLGRCWEAIGQPAQAATLYRQELKELAQLEPSDGVKREMGVTQADLGDVLCDTGDYGAARQAYEASLAIAETQNDNRQQGVVNFQLGTLTMLEGNLAEAETRYQSALKTFRTLDEPEQEARVWHQLGMVYGRAKAWEQAEQAYRASAQLKEAQGNIGGNNGAATTWNQLALVCEYSGKPKEAEAWYRKAIEAFRREQDSFAIAKMLSNLADLLQTQGNLAAAQSIAEEALALKQTLDPAAAEIWKIYNLLAQIATQQGDAATAQVYRRQSRQSYAAFAGSRYELQKWEDLIQGVIAAVDDAAVRQQLEAALSQVPALATAIRRIWDGVRDEEVLCEVLGYREALIVGEILRRLGS